MAFLQIQTRTGTAAPLAVPGLAIILRTILKRLANRPRRSPEDLLDAQVRRAEARTAVDRLLR